MSQLQKEDGPSARKRGAFAASTMHLTPELNDRFDRFCTTCGEVMENVALERIPNQVCSRCRTKVYFQEKSDGLYSSCVRCVTMLRCTMKYCYMCRRANQYFDPEKPARLQRALEGKLTIQIKTQIQEQNAAKLLSQECINDGEYQQEQPKVDDSLQNQQASQDRDTQQNAQEPSPTPADATTVDANSTPLKQS